MPNRLAGETSPYLLQHKDNPVDWYPWGAEALAAARERDVPILLSIGYSACHWCHVMERESFEDADTAALMNERFVCIKLDREERPDLDAIYMEACQAMTGHGGWPLNVFLTPEQVPFYAGTYFPPEERQGMPLAARAGRRARGVGRARATRSAPPATGGPAPAGGAALQPASEPLDAGLLDAAVEGLRGIYDAAHGGFGGAPKFPPASTIEFLLRRGETRDEPHTLRAMAAGGMYDQVGGGFARYSVDARWLVPHFEKMLYDNALLARAYLHGWQVTGDELLRARLRGDARLDAARAARTGGRLLLRAGRRLRGRGGPVLRVDARPAARRAGTRRRRGGRRLLRRPTPAATSRAARSSPAARTSRRAWPTSARGCTRRAPSACGRGSTTSG